jgi:cystathionine beta-lyase
VWVIADEIHAPLVLPGATHVPWLELSDAARSCGFALTSASKAFNLAGLKAALLVTASERTRAAADRLPALAEHAGLLGVLASEVAFSDADDWLDAVLIQLDANRTLLGRLLAEQLPEVRWTPPQASYLAWLDCRALDLGDDPAAVFLDRGRVALAPGVNYGPQSGKGHVRLNFGTSAELVGDMVQRMIAARITPPT